MGKATIWERSKIPNTNGGGAVRWWRGRASNEDFRLNGGSLHPKRPHERSYVYSSV